MAEGTHSQFLPVKEQTVYFGPDCQPCTDKGREVRSSGFCETCDTFLCTDCTTLHNTVQENHPIFDTRKPTTGVAAGANKRMEVCKIHNKAIELYCYSDDEVLCSQCISPKHSKCHIDYIPSIAAKMEPEEMFKKLTDEINIKVDPFKEGAHHLQQDLSNLKTGKPSFEKSVERVKKVYHALVDRRAEELLSQMRTLHGEETKTLSKEEERKTKTTKAMEDTRHKVCASFYTGNMSKLFILQKLARQELSSFAVNREDDQVKNLLEFPHCQNVFRNFWSMNLGVHRLPECSGSSPKPLATGFSTELVLRKETKPRKRDREKESFPTARTNPKTSMDKKKVTIPSFSAQPHTKQGQSGGQSKVDIRKEITSVTQTPLAYIKKEKPELSRPCEDTEMKGWKPSQSCAYRYTDSGHSDTVAGISDDSSTSERPDPSTKRIKIEPNQSVKPRQRSAHIRVPVGKTKQATQIESKQIKVNLPRPSNNDRNKPRD